MTSAILTVSQLNRYAKAVLDAQPQLTDLMVRGELTDVSYNRSSGHLYFTLADSGAVLRCVMFAQYVQRLREIPQDGFSTVVRGTATLYERGGQFQLLAYDIQTLGVGTGSEAYEKLRARLAAEGLFAESRKRLFLPLPEAVGVITSPDGAALHDVIATMQRRNPLVRLIVYPAVMQGALAAGSIRSAIEAMEAEGRCQAAIITRGGGSTDDLSIFNDEALVRRVCACRVPVVSAVGHEVDTTLLDDAADARAATPTAACALVCADIGELRRSFLDRLERLRAASPQAKLELYCARTEGRARQLTDAMERRLTELSYRAESALRQLALLNPAALLLRGYSLTTRGGEIIRRADTLTVGDLLETTFAAGSARSTVTQIIPQKMEEHNG